MGPRDPFATPPAAERPAPGPAARPDLEGREAGDANGPVRVHARMPAPPSVPSPTGRPVVVGAAVGAAVGFLFVLLEPGQAFLVLVLTVLGAALGAIVRAAFRDGVDLEAAWRALRRQ